MKWVAALTGLAAANCRAEPIEATTGLLLLVLGLGMLKISMGMFAFRAVMSASTKFPKGSPGSER